MSETPRQSWNLKRLSLEGQRSKSIRKAIEVTAAVSLASVLGYALIHKNDAKQL